MGYVRFPLSGSRIILVGLVCNDKANATEYCKKNILFLFHLFPDNIVFIFGKNLLSIWYVAREIIVASNTQRKYKAM